LNSTREANRNFVHTCPWDTRAVRRMRARQQLARKDMFVVNSCPAQHSRLPSISILGGANANANPTHQLHTTIIHSPCQKSQGAHIAFCAANLALR
jgi:hypothetical protein